MRCPDYSAVDAAVGRSLDLLGGIRRFVGRGDRVLVKPNLLAAYPPETGVNTHPAFVRAVVRAVQRAGGKVTIGDSPGGLVRSVEKVFEKSGMKVLASEVGVELVNFDKSRPHRFVVNGRELFIAAAVLSADVVINLPKLKTHYLTTLTAAVKNTYGCVPGFCKMQYHRLYLSSDLFADLLIDINSLVRPSLTLVDAVVSMEGDGPSQGRLRETGLVFAGTDDHSVDLAVGRALGCPPERISTLRRAAQRGLLREPDVVGETHARVERFRLHSMARFHALLDVIPSQLGRLFSSVFWVRPEFDGTKPAVRPRLRASTEGFDRAQPRSSAEVLGRAAQANRARAARSVSRAARSRR